MPEATSRFVYGVLKYLIENGLVDREFIAARITGWEAAAAKGKSILSRAHIGMQFSSLGMMPNG